MIDQRYQSTKLEHEVLKYARYMKLVVDKQGLVTDVETPGIEWQVQGLKANQQLPDVLQAIIDVCDAAPEPHLFSYVQLAQNLCVDVYVLVQESSYQVVLQDVSKGHESTHKYQQKAHEVNLLLERQAELNRLLEEKRAEAEEASKAKSRFIAMMSHEFRSPISSIMAHAEALSSTGGNAREPAAIQRASWYLLTLIENLLEQAKMDQQDRKLDFSSVEIPALLNDMKQLFSIQAGSKGLSFDIEYSADGEGFVLGDELRLRQVLVNLLSNAMRYTRDGSVKLVCTDRGDSVEFSVTDTGRGIGEADLENIFQPFTRINPGGEGGAGLGLTISRQLISAMNGTLSVTSRINEGSTFSFSLPVPEEHQRKPVESLKGLNVLVVEDDVDLREMYCIWLEDWGATVRTVSGVEQAMEAFLAEPSRLVMTDLFLEDGDGVELLAKLREIEPHLATVLCSASDSIQSCFADDRGLVDAFIAKPVNAVRLEKTLKTAVQLAKHQ